VKRTILSLAIALVLTAAGSSRAQESANPKSEAIALEIGLNAAGLKGDSFSDFETRLLVGGMVLANLGSGWGVEAGLDMVWVDQPATSYLYYLLVQRELPALDRIEPFLATGVGGLTTRLDTRGVDETRSDWLVPLVAGLRWSRIAESHWGIRASFTDYVVWEELPLIIPVGGATSEVGETRVTHNLAFSLGLLFHVGGGSP